MTAELALMLHWEEKSSSSPRARHLLNLQKNRSYRIGQATPLTCWVLRVRRGSNITPDKRKGSLN
jgi:hypothetical protein